VDVRVDHAGRNDEARAADGLLGLVPSFELYGLVDRDDAPVANRDRAVVDDVARRVHRHDVPALDEQIDRLADHASPRRPLRVASW
jgi:hypothetical protein